MQPWQIKRSRLLAAIAAGSLFWPASVSWAASLSLDEAVQLALAQNTDLRITRQGELKADAQLRNAKGQNSVSVDVSDTLSTRRTEGESSSAGNSADVSARLPLYSGGANEANIEQSKLGVETANMATERARENLKYNVIKAYYNAVESLKNVEVRRETVGNYAAHLNDVEALYGAGAQARIDVLRSSVELSNARQDLIKAENSYEVNLATLRNLVNIDRNEPLTLTTDVTYSPFAASMEECIDNALTNRLDLKASEYELEQQELSIKAAKAGYKPSVNLTIGGGYSSQFRPSSDNSYSTSAGLGLSWNIFDSGVTKAKVDAAIAERDSAFLNVIKTRENIDLGVREAYYNMREAEKRFTSTGDAVKKAEEDYFIARERYRAGEGVILDIFDAQLALSTAKFNDISARYDYARYRAEVDNLMGSSLTTAEKNAATGLKYVTAEERDGYRKAREQ